MLHNLFEVVIYPCTQLKQSQHLLLPWDFKCTPQLYNNIYLSEINLNVLIMSMLILVMFSYLAYVHV